MAPAETNDDEVSLQTSFVDASHVEMVNRVTEHPIDFTPIKQDKPMKFDDLKASPNKKIVEEEIKSTFAS